MKQSTSIGKFSAPRDSLRWRRREHWLLRHERELDDHRAPIDALPVSGAETVSVDRCMQECPDARDTLRGSKGL